MTDPSTQKRPLTRKQVQALPTEVLGSFLATTGAYVEYLEEEITEKRTLKSEYECEMSWLRREIKNRKGVTNGSSSQKAG
jgi:hypothetical protein